MKKGYYLTSCREYDFNQVCKTQKDESNVTTEKKLQEIQL